MDKKFNTLVIISVIFHGLLTVLLAYFVLQNSFSFQIHEKETIMSVRRMSTKNFSFKRKNFKDNNHSSYKTKRYTSDFVREMVSVNEKIDMDVKEENNNLIVRNSSVDNLKFKENNHDIISEEDFSSFDVKKELESLNSKGISFMDGQSRKLLNNYNNELAALNLQTNTNCEIKIHINSDGFIEYAEIIESTGSLEKDNAILEVIKKWQFVKSVKNIQIAQIKIKYYLK